LLIANREATMAKKKLNPMHPGKILLEEFLKPMAIILYHPAKDIHVCMLWVKVVYCPQNSGVAAKRKRWITKER
jgi:hypothetical protein